MESRYKGMAWRTASGALARFSLLAPRGTSPLISGYTPEGFAVQHSALGIFGVLGWGFYDLDIILSCLSLPDLRIIHSPLIKNYLQISSNSTNRVTDTRMVSIEDKTLRTEMNHASHTNG